MPLKPVVARVKDCKPIWLLRDFLTPLIVGQHTGNRVALAMSGAHPGDGPPPHVHRREDEAFYILQGELTLLFGQKLIRAGAGSFVWAPRGIVHRFECTSRTPARYLLFVAPTDFLNFAMAIAEPADDFAAPPVVTQEKIAQLMSVAPTYGIELAPQHPMPTETIDAPPAERGRWVFGTLVKVLADSTATGGQFTFSEFHTSPQSSPPMHTHDPHDEYLVGLAGHHEVNIEGQTERLGVGDACFIPSGVSHSFRCVDDGRGKMFVIHSPGGFEKFFDEVGVPATTDAPPNVSPPTPQQIAAICRRHGMALQT